MWANCPGSGCHVIRQMGSGQACGLTAGGQSEEQLSLWGCTKGTPEECRGGPFLYQPQETKPFLWIVRSLIRVEVCRFWLYLVAQHSEVIHLLTRSRTVPQPIEQSWDQHCSTSTFAGQMFVFYSLQKQRCEARWRQATVLQQLRPRLAFVFSRHSRDLWQFSVSFWRQKLFSPKDQLIKLKYPFWPPSLRWPSQLAEAKGTLFSFGKIQQRQLTSAICIYIANIFLLHYWSLVD